jgi:hypothetical protein
VYTGTALAVTRGVLTGATALVETRGAATVVTGAYV